MLRVTILGNGNVGRFFAKHCTLSPSMTLVQWYGRNNNFPEETTAQTTNRLTELHDADLYIICVQDAAIKVLAEEVHLKGMLVHTSGTVSITALQKHARYGVCYPLQSISAPHFPNPTQVPLCIEANNKEGETLLKSFALGLKMQNHLISSQQRKALHLAAVFANNFSNHLFTRAAAICKSENVDFNLLHPLLLHTVHQLQSKDPKTLQTGPARRNDQTTIEEHLKALNASDAKEIYTLMTKAIQNYYEEEL